MGVLLWARDITSDIDGVKNTYSSWDTCMTKAYCKWPAIIGIVLGALIVLSILSCVVRCLCCGAECCCGCLSCCNACCPSPRRRHQGYQQQPLPPPTPYQQYPMYNQYQPPPQGPMYSQPPPQGPVYSQQPPVYSSGGLGYRGAPQTATFDTPSTRKPLSSAANADALPAMPTWDSAHTRRVEDDEEMEDVEMEKLVARPNARSPAQATSPWSPQPHSADPRQPLYPPSAAAGYEHAYHSSQASPPPPASPYAAANPYADHGNSGSNSNYYYSSHTAPAAQNAYPPSYHTNAPAPSVSPYDYPQHDDAAAYPAAAARTQEPRGPPSYHTSPPPAGLQVGRRPVQGSWREV